VSVIACLHQSPTRRAELVIIVRQRPDQSTRIPPHARAFGTVTGKRWNGRLILIGHSWGGSLAAQYAVAHPDHISRLVFHSPAGITWTGEPNEYERSAAVDALDGKLR
jgi:pimeloyl-ACP methyl ester carboxylesterase